VLTTTKLLRVNVNQDIQLHATLKPKLEQWPKLRSHSENTTKVGAQKIIHTEVNKINNQRLQILGLCGNLRRRVMASTQVNLVVP